MLPPASLAPLFLCFASAISSVGSLWSGMRSWREEEEFEAVIFRNFLGGRAGKKNEREKVGRGKRRFSFSALNAFLLSPKKTSPRR